MNVQLENGFPVNPIRVDNGIVLINIFTLDPDKAEQFVATQVGEYKRLKGQFPGSYTANLHISLDRTRAANYAHFTSVEDYVVMRNSPEFADHLQRLQGLVIKAEPQLYQVIYTQHLDMPTSEEPLPALPNPEFAPSLAPPLLS
ncbi:antibiotic biosynthesis monooxygenase family protein [Phormidesmis sp. 146-35]